MRKLMIEIAMKNSAFQDGNEGRHQAAEILEFAAAKLRNGDEARHLWDSNGNRVGFYTITEEA